MPRIPERSRLPFLVGVSLLALVLVAGAVIVIPRLVPSDPTPTSSSTLLASPIVDPSTPEGAVRAFFEAYVEARRTDDPTVILPFVTSEASSAYRSVEGFLAGQQSVGKASITTILDITNVRVDSVGDRAMVKFDFTEGGYDISLDTGEPLESPVVLPAREVTVEVARVQGRWLVDRYEAGL